MKSHPTRQAARPQPKKATPKRPEKKSVPQRDGLAKFARSIMGR
jgi:hypothetical protein